MPKLLIIIGIAKNRAELFQVELANKEIDVVQHTLRHDLIIRTFLVPLSLHSSFAIFFPYTII